jgi:hypothetical protein
MEGRQRRSFTERSISNSASIRRTTSIAIGESAICFLPAALQRAFSTTKLVVRLLTRFNIPELGSKRR